MYKFLPVLSSTLASSAEERNSPYCEKTLSAKGSYLVNCKQIFKVFEDRFKFFMRSPFSGWECHHCKLVDHLRKNEANISYFSETCHICGCIIYHVTKGNI